MRVYHQIKNKIEQYFQVIYLKIEDESHMHRGDNVESHFKLTVVSDDFLGKRLIQRHRLLNELLADELEHDIHALALHLYTKDEWENLIEERKSPACIHKEKMDK